MLKRLQLGLALALALASAWPLKAMLPPKYNLGEERLKELLGKAVPEAEMQANVVAFFANITAKVDKWALNTNDVGWHYREESPYPANALFLGFMDLEHMADPNRCGRTCQLSCWAQAGLNCTAPQPCDQEAAEGAPQCVGLRPQCQPGCSAVFLAHNSTLSGGRQRSGRRQSSGRRHHNQRNQAHRRHARRAPPARQAEVDGASDAGLRDYEVPQKLPPVDLDKFEVVVVKDDDDWRRSSSSGRRQQGRQQGRQHGRQHGRRQHQRQHQANQDQLAAFAGLVHFWDGLERVRGAMPTNIDSWLDEQVFGAPAEAELGQLERNLELGLEILRVHFREWGPDPEVLLASQGSAEERSALVRSALRWVAKAVWGNLLAGECLYCGECAPEEDFCEHTCRPAGCLDHACHCEPQAAAATTAAPAQAEPAAAEAAAAASGELAPPNRRRSHKRLH